jgi:hypothetical protein
MALAPRRDCERVKASVRPYPRRWWALSPGWAFQLSTATSAARNPPGRVILKLNVI